MKKNKTIVLILTIFLFLSCVSNKTDVDFFINKGNMQYFFPPKVWGGPSDNISFEGDLLYRNYPTADDEDKEPKSLFNFTLFSESILFRSLPRSIVLSSNGVRLVIPDNKIRIIFIDKGRTRYTSWVYSSSLNDFMTDASQSIKLELVYDDISYEFNSPSGFISHINYYKEVILGIYP